MYTLGTVARLGVQSLDDFDYPQTTSLVSVLSDGTSEQNQVLQQGSLPLRQADVKGRLLDAADVATLRGYYKSKETVALHDGVSGEYSDVIVFAFSASRQNRWIWEYSMTLIEAPA